MCQTLSIIAIVSKNSSSMEIAAKKLSLWVRLKIVKNIQSSKMEKIIRKQRLSKESKSLR